MAYLPGVEVNHDHEGGSSRMRLSHCTSGQLTPTMVSNVDHLNAQFLLVGDCVRAIPQIRNQAKWQSEDVGWFTLKTDIAKFLFVPGQRSCIWLHLLISPLTITKLSKWPSNYSLIHFYKRCVSKACWIAFNSASFFRSKDTPLKDPKYASRAQFFIDNRA